MQEYQEILESLIHLINKASKKTLRDFFELGGNGISSQKKAQFARNTDEKMEMYIVKELKKINNTIPILLEGNHRIEGGHESLMFIVDPVDGTANFANNIKDFGISIALLENGETIIGVISFPIHQEIFVSSKYESYPYIIDVRDEKIKIRCSRNFHKSESFLLTRTSMMRDEKNLKILQKLANEKIHIRSTGCVTLDLAYLSCGRADIIIYDTTNIWDIAAGEFIAKASGAKIIKKDNYFIASSSIKITNEISDLI